MNKWWGIALKCALLTVLTCVATESYAGQWNVGDIFVGVGQGQYLVLRIQGKTVTVVDTLAGNSTGVTAGCAFDSTWRAYTTDATNTTVNRYAISHPHPILLSFNAGGAAGTGDKSVVFDSVGNLYAGHSGGSGEIDKFSPTGSLLTSLSTGGFQDTAGSEWLDISANGSYLIYTSGGARLFLYTLSSNTIQVFTLSNLPNLTFFNHAVRVLSSDANGNPTAILVAAGPKILQFSVNATANPPTAAVTATYDTSGGSTANWTTLTLDPRSVNSSGQYTTFYAGDTANQRLARFLIVSSGNVKKADLVVGLSSLVPANVSSLAYPFGLCSDGGFSANQPGLLSPTPASATLTKNSTITATFNTASGNQFAATMTQFPSGTNTVTATLFYTDFDPSGGAGTGDDGTACIPIAPPVAGGLSTKCEAYKLEFSTPPPSGKVNLGLTLTQKLTTPPQPAGTNPKFYSDMFLDKTDYFLLDPKTGGTCCSTVFSIQNANVTTGAVSCGFQSPIVDGGIYNLGQNLTFKFRAGVSPAACASNGPFLDTINPRMTQVFEPANGDSPFKIAITATGNAGTTDPATGDGIFSLSSGDSWDLQLSTKGLPAGKYIYTVFDTTNQIPEFSVEITLQ